MTRRLRSITRGGAVLWILAVVAPAPGRAQSCQWPLDPAMPVALSSLASSGSNRRSTIVSDGQGGAIVTWVDTRVGTADIFASRINRDGFATWQASGIGVGGGPGTQTMPAITTDGSGGAIIAWQDDRSGNYDIYVQRVISDGVPWWSPTGVPVCTAAGAQTGVKIAPDGNGGAVMVWLDARTSPARAFAAHVTSSGVVNWAPNGVQVNSTSTLQPAIASDGAGGAIVCWGDGRAASYWDIYAQRLDFFGNPLWVADGVGLCTANQFQDYSAIVPDGAGGAIVAWRDDRPGGIYAQRVNAAGVPQWAANGISDPASGYSGCCELDLASDGAGGAVAGWVGGGAYVRRFAAAGTVSWTTRIADNVYNMNLTSDGSGGAFAAWYDSRPGAPGLYLQRVGGAGGAAWAAGGVRMTSLSQGVFPDITNLVPDGRGGAIVSWSRSGVFAHHIDRQGQFGDAAPVLTRARDVPNDQGGSIKLEWDATCLEDAAVGPVTEYWILRSAPPNYVTSALAQGARLAADISILPRAGERLFIADPAANGYAWEWLGSQTAFHASRYSFIAATTGDSINGSNPLTAFAIQARRADGTLWRFSNPESAYSVDNLAPAQAGAFTAQYFAGSAPNASQSSLGYAWLHWTPSPEADLSEYRIHRGATADFVPSPANLVVAKTDTGFVDQNVLASYYKLIVVDTHGNLSEAVTTLPSGVTGVGETGTIDDLALFAPWPNPTAGDVQVSFALPRAGRVSLALFDLGGRRVSDLTSGTMEAGRHRFPLRLGSGSPRSLPNGMYYLRLEAEGRSISRRIALMR